MKIQNIELTERTSLPFRKVSWGAIFAATALVLSLQMLMGLVGLSFGFGSINPQMEKAPFAGLGTATVAWLIVTTIVTLFLGGLVAGRLNPSMSKVRGLLHGATAWALASLATVYIFSAAVGGVAKLTGGAIGSLVEVVGKGAGVAVSEGMKVARKQLPSLDLSSVKSEAGELLGSTAEGVARNPQNASEELDELVDKVFGTSGSADATTDRAKLVQLLVAQGGMSRADAESSVAQWEKTVSQAKEKWEQAKVEAEIQARAAGQAVADAGAKAAAWASLFLFLGLVACSLGGWIGTPSEPLAVPGTRRIDLSDLSSAA